MYIPSQIPLIIDNEQHNPSTLKFEHNTLEPDESLNFDLNLYETLDTIIEQILFTHDKLLQQSRELKMWPCIHCLSCTHHPDISNPLSITCAYEVHEHLTHLWDTWYQQWTTLNSQLHHLFLIFAGVNTLSSEVAATQT